MFFEWFVGGDETEENTYYGRMANKIWEEGVEELDRIEDKKVRLEKMGQLISLFVVECLNDLDKRIIDLDRRLRQLEPK